MTFIIKIKGTINRGNSKGKGPVAGKSSCRGWPTTKSDEESGTRS